MSYTNGLSPEAVEAVKKLAACGDEVKLFEILGRSIKCTTPGYDEVKTLWDYLQVVNIIHKGEEKNTNYRTLVRLWGKDIHPVYADYLIVCTADELVKLVGSVRIEHDTPEKLKVSYARLLKCVSEFAPKTAEILRSKEYEKDKNKQDFKYAQYEVVMGLYIVKYLLLGKPFNLATEVCISEYDLDFWVEPSDTMDCWCDFVNDRRGRRHGRMITPKDQRPASYILEDRGFCMLTEGRTHDLMRSVRQVRKGKHTLVPEGEFAEFDKIYPFDGMDFNGKKWSGIILSQIVVKAEDGEINPNGGEIIHTLTWEVFGQDTTKLEGKNFSLLLFNNQRRRDLAYEWMWGEPVVYDD